MSLGGYTASLLATVTSDVDFVLSYIPIASVPDVMNDNDLVPGTGDIQLTLAQKVPVSGAVIAGDHVAMNPLILAVQ